MQNWAFFENNTHMVPAIPLDPEPSKRPDVILLRVTDQMQSKQVPIEENWDFLLSPAMRPRGFTQGSDPVCARYSWAAVHSSV